MRIAVVTVIVVLLSAVGLLWYQVRYVNDSFMSYSVRTEQSRLVEARLVEAMLRADRVDQALDHLQRNRDISVIQLASTRSAIGELSWRWNHSEYQLRYATNTASSELRLEAEYRGTFGASNSRLAQLAKEALEEFSH